MTQAVSVLGSGTMGCDVAILCARSGFHVRLWHRTSASLCEHSWRDRVSNYRSRGILEGHEFDALVARTAFTSSLDFAAGAAWIFETVVEDPEVKARLLKKVDSLRGLDSVLMTNTSSLNICELATGLAHAESFAGVHFFNPALRIRVVEVAAAEGTGAECLHRIAAWLSRLEKEPIRVKAVPGFVVNRLMAGLVCEAFRLIEEGVATPDEIDRLAVGALGHPIGPMALADLVGLEVMEAILANLSRQTLRSDLCPSKELRRLVSAGKLGRKTGAGLHNYPR